MGPLRRVATLGIALSGLISLVVACPNSGQFVVDDDDSAEDPTPGECPVEIAEQLAQLASWQVQVACADMEFGTAPDDDQNLAVALSLHLSGVEYVPGQTFETALVGDALRVQTGEHLLHYDCNDAIEHTEIVEREWLATGGSAHVEVLHTANGSAEIRLTLTGVTVEETATPGTLCQLPDVVYDSLWIGWYPG